jgi:rhodanese-related sulfurtransferase
LLDARPPVEYQTGHLPGALSVPIEAVEELLASLPDDKTIVAYCRGPYCVLADEVLAILSQAGKRTMRLEEGVTEWQMAGYEVIHS